MIKSAIALGYDAFYILQKKNGWCMGNYVNKGI